MKFIHSLLPLSCSVFVFADVSVCAQSTTTTSTTSVTASTTAGLVSEIGPEAIILRTQGAASPIRYSSSITTVFEDENGRPVSRELVTSGLPVTVQYSRDGDSLYAQRVIVHRAEAAAPTVIEKTTTITPAPVIVEKPVIVERKVPVVVEKKVPVVIERKVPVSRPVIVEKTAPTEVIEKKTTTTTTTTDSRR